MKNDQASSTAYTVLQGLLLTAGKAEFAHLVTPETVSAARSILEVTEEGRKRLRQLDSGLHRSMLGCAEALLMPGISIHYALRKKFIRDAVEQALRDGYRNVVNLGAGFDTSMVELHGAHPEACFFELDHPATSAHKTRALAGRIGPNLHFQAVDFGEANARDVLRAHTAFDPSLKSLFICEGVLMYLDIADVERVFAGLKELCAGPLRFVFSCVAPMTSDANNCGALLRLYLKIKGEPLNWSLMPGELTGFVQSQSYDLLDRADTDVLRARYLPDPISATLHRGEFLALTATHGTGGA